MSVSQRSVRLCCALMVAAGLIAVGPDRVALAEDASAATAFGWGAPDAALSDEFDGGSAPSPAFWESYASAGHDGNGLRRPSQNTVDDGHLQIAGLADGTSGGMMSHRVYPAFGRWEVRMRVDEQGVGSAYHPVVALIPAGVPYAGGAGDLDFAESDAGSGRAYVFVHYPPNKQDYASVPVDLADWHTYAIEVAPDHVSWFVDGAVAMTDTNPAAITGVDWTTNIQLDAYHPSGLAPSNLQVDYLRFYPLPSSGVPTVPGPAPSAGAYR